MQNLRYAALVLVALSAISISCKKEKAASTTGYNLVFKFKFDST